MDGQWTSYRAKPRILFLNRSYWPDNEATGQLLTQLCEDLAKDFEVHVLAGHPNVVQVGIEWEKAGNEIRHGVHIHRVRHVRFAKHSFIGRVFNMCTFTLSAFLWVLTCKSPRVVISETDPFLLQFIALVAKIRHRCKYIAYLQDIYPDIAVAVGKVRESPLTRSLRKALWFAYRNADRIVVLSAEMRDRCIRNGADAEQFEIIRNWTDTEVIIPTDHQNSFRHENGINGEFVVMYSGNHGLAHELMPIIDAAERLHVTNPNVLFALVGGGVRKQSLEAEAQARGLTNVRSFPYQPWSELSNSLGAANVHLLAVKQAAIDCMSPSKLYGILAAGRPVIAIVNAKSTHAKLVSGNDVGLVCDVANQENCGERLALQIAELSSDPGRVEQMGLTARKLAENRFDRPRQTAKFAQLLHQAIGDQRIADSGVNPALIDTVPELDALRSDIPIVPDPSKVKECDEPTISQTLESAVGAQGE